MYQNLPNILSFIRILLTPLFILFMIQDEPQYKIFSLVLVFLLSITDFFDGYFARTYNLISNFGKYLDPLADKLFLLTVFTTLHIIYSDYITLWMILLIGFRDILITILRNILIKKGFSFNTSNLAKYKTIIQIISIHLILFLIILNEYYIIKINFNVIYYIMLVCTMVTIVSGLDYILYYVKLKKNEFQ